MARVCYQRIIFTVVVFAALSHAAAAGRDANLADACAHLCAGAIQKPYGWGWPATAAEVTAKTPAPPVTIDLLPTAQRGLVLLLAGEINGDPAALHGAIQAARLLAAAQDSTGRIPTQVILGNAPVRVVERQIVPNRQTTVAALAFLLMIDAKPVDGSELSSDRAEQLRRAARRAAYWLVRQQAQRGGWPDDPNVVNASAIANGAASANPSAPANGSAAGNDFGSANGSSAPFGPASVKYSAPPTKLMLLDRPGYRDCTVALLLAAEDFNDSGLRHQASMAAQQLIDLRIDSDARAGVDLWHSAATFNGEAAIDPATQDLADPNRALRLPDLLASRLCVQTLAASYLLSGDDPALKIASHACDAARELRDADGRWRRFPGATSPQKNPPPTADVFGPPEGSVAPAPTTIDLSPMIQLVTALRITGADDFKKNLPPPLDVNQRLALALAGLADFPLDPAMHPRPSAMNDAIGAEEGDAILAALAGSPDTGASPMNR